MTLSWGGKTPIVHRQDARRLHERLLDLPEDWARYVAGAPLSRTLKRTAIVAGAAALLLGFWSASQVAL